MKAVAQQLDQHFNATSDAVKAHLSGGSFAVLLPNRDLETCVASTKALLKHLQQASPAPTVLSANAGIANFQSQLSSSELLSVADNALREAITQGPYQVAVASEPLQEKGLHQTASHWRDLLQEKDIAERVVLHFQTVYSIDKSEILHDEVLLRARDDQGALVTAGVLMPLVEQLGLSVKLDTIVLTKLLEYLKQADDPKRLYAMNLSASSLQDAEFLQTLQEAGDLAQQLVFEITEATAVNLIEPVKQFQKILQTVGAGLAIDHFGRSFEALGYLAGLKLVYIKLDGHYTQGTQLALENQFLIHSVTDIAHTLDIKVIAENIEDPAQLEALRELKVDGAQGYGIAKPEARG